MKQEYGIDTSHHKSKLLTKTEVLEADIIIPVKKSLGSYIANIHPESVQKLHNFSTDIEDPWRQPYNVYQHCARQIDQLVAEVLDGLVERS